MDYSNLFVCLMGLGTVFFGLIILILLTYVMSFFCRKGGQTPPPLPATDPAPSAPEPNRQEMIAAISAALAEELGTDVSGIRILSVKKL